MRTCITGAGPCSNTASVLLPQRDGNCWPPLDVAQARRPVAAALHLAGGSLMPRNTVAGVTPKLRTPSQEHLMNISDICRHDVISIDSNGSLCEAATLMLTHHIGAIVVTVNESEGERAIGVLTDRDLAVKTLARGLDVTGVTGLTAGQLASRELVAVPGDGTIADAVATMEKAGVRRLLVTGQHGELSGIISSDDLFAAMAAQLATLSSALRNGLAREATQHRPEPVARPRPVFLAYGTPGMQRGVMSSS
jgi:CBS domain-containing protein